MASAMDFENGRLETGVSKPQKENEGSKDSFVSYLVTTKVSYSDTWNMGALTYMAIDRLQELYETGDECTAAIHGFCLPL